MASSRSNFPRLICIGLAAITIPRFASAAVALISSYEANSSSKASACFKSRVSNPSVNQA
jgi:hypothetical protein